MSWFGIALYEPKIDANLGTILRSAHVFGAAFVATIGARYREVSSDTTKAQRHLPVLYFPDWTAFTETMRHYPLVGIECRAGAKLHEFQHPKQSIYVLGGEDRTIPHRCELYAHFDTAYCTNVAIAASIVMYARSIQVSHAAL